MTMERLVTFNDERSRHLPPLEAWKNPSKWLDLSTGLAKPDVPLLVLPTDERGFLRPDQVIDIMIDRFFWSDYDWPFDPDDKETRPDDHHFYYYRRLYLPGAHEGDEVPWEFREQATSIGRMPRQLHNAIHDLTAPPEMPDYEAMKQYNESYQLAVRIFKQLQRRMNKIIERKDLAFDARFFDEFPREFDPIAEAFIESFFKRHFTSYSNAIESFRNQHVSPELSRNNLVESPLKMTEFAGAIGSIATQSYFNFTPVLQAA